MATQRSIARRVEERDAKEQERADLESKGVRIDSPQIRAIDDRLRELNDEIAAYGRTIPLLPELELDEQAQDGVDSGRREESK